MNQIANLPTGAEVRAARKSVGLSQSAAAELVYLSRRAWQTYEEEVTPIKLGLWELFLFKTGQLFIKPTAAVIGVKVKRAHPGRVENLRPLANRKGSNHAVS